MVIFLYRPSPQVPKPTKQAALRCFESAAHVIDLSSQQVKRAAVDITWVFLLTVYTSLNIVLWAVSYPEVREIHTREESEELINISLDIIDQCSERWPGTTAASQLYAVFARACLQSYAAKEKPQPPKSNGNRALHTPPPLADTDSPSASEVSTSTPASASTVRATQQQGAQPRPAFNPPQFGHVFDSTPEQMSAGFSFDPDSSPFQNSHPTFRSNSIFMNPATDSHGRRFSLFPPDFTQSAQTKPAGESGPLTPNTPYNSQTSPSLQSPFSQHTSQSMMTYGADTMPTPPRSLAPQSYGESDMSSLSPTPPAIKMESATPTPNLPYASPAQATAAQASPAPAANLKYEPGEQPTPPNRQAQTQLPPPQPPRAPATFTIPAGPPQQGAAARQRPLPPTTVTDWFSPPPPFISPYAFPGGGMGGGGGYWGDDYGNAAAAAAPFSGLGIGFGFGGAGGGYGLSGGDSRDGGFAAGGGGGPFAENGVGGGGGGGGPPFLQYAFPPERHGSLSVEQQVELMDVLETEGVGEIDAFLSTGMGIGGGGGGGISWG